MGNSNSVKQTSRAVVRARVLSGIVVTVVMFGLAYLGGWVLFFGLVASLAVALYELFHALAIKGYHPIPMLGFLLGLTILAGVQLDALLIWVGLLGAVAGVLLLSLIGVRSLSDTVITIVAAFYFGLLLSQAILIRSLPQGFQWLVFVLGGVSASDVCAYAIGSILGKHKLAPRVSPGKTIEGLFGGLAGCLLALFALNTLFGIVDWRLIPIFGLVFTMCDLTGDLLASWVKRYAGVKDYSKLIPGHGGLLDRIDGLLFTLPVAHALIRLLALR